MLELSLLLARHDFLITSFQALSVTSEKKASLHIKSASHATQANEQLYSQELRGSSCRYLLPAMLQAANLWHANSSECQTAVFHHLQIL